MPKRKRPSPSTPSNSSKILKHLRGTAKSVRHEQIAQGKGYSSDGMSFESEKTSDDELLLPDVKMSSPEKEKKFSKDDIVWAPYKKYHWPAVVTSVGKHQVRFVYINECRKTVFKKNVKKLIPFDNPVINQKLKEEGEKNCRDVREAYELVVKYLIKKKDLKVSARRFLTSSDKNDSVRQAKDFLVRLGVTEESEDSDEESLSLDDSSSDKDVDILGISDDEQDDNEQNERKEFNVRDAQVKEIMKDLETLPADMTVSSQELEQMEEEARKLLSLIKSEACYIHLDKIRRGLNNCMRHDRFQTEGLTQGAFGPFTLFEDLKNELLTVMDDHFENCDPLYKYSVMLPEAIIFAIAKLKKWRKSAAEKYFQSTSSKVGVLD